MTTKTVSGQGALAIDAMGNVYTDACKSSRIVISLLGTQPVQQTGLEDQAALDFMLSHWNNELEQVLPNSPDLIILPEACDRYLGLSPEKQKEWYRFRNNRIRDYFSAVAMKHSCYIAYAAHRLMQDGSIRNSIQLLDRRGKVTGVYNKNHLVPKETFNMGILCGREAPVFQTDFGRVAFAICFDLNFQELLDKYAEARPDLIVFSSMYHGGLMQKYWAYHCRSYFAAAYPGECSVVNPLGEVVARTTNYARHLTTSVNLDNILVHLDENQPKLSRLKKKYGRMVTIQDPGFLGVVLVTSEAPDITVQDMIREFEIETWDEYYARCLKHRHIPEHMEP